MNADVFDALARRFALAGSQAGTRRAVLRALGLGAGATALASGTVGAAPAVGVRVPRVRGQEAAPPSLVEDLAFELEFDIAKIAAFVAEEIRYEPYAGALRGPVGTIWAGAGNAVDQAQLLAALLDASLVPVRFAVGQAEATALGEQHALGLGRVGMSPVIDRVISAHLVAAYPDADSSLIAGPTPPGVRIASSRDELLSEAAGRVETMAERLTGALRDAGVALIAGEVTVPASEVDRHVWVQYASGTDWVDLDPSLPEDALRTDASRAETLDAIPDDWFHTITVRVSHDQTAGEGLERVVSLEHTVRSQDMTNGSLALLHLDGDEMTTLGFDLGAKLAGSQGSYAMILAGTEFFYGAAPMTFGGQGGVLDVFEDGAGLPEGEAIAEFFDIEVRSPNDEPLVANRTIFDRVADQRGGSGFDLAGVKAVELTDIGTEKKQFLPLAPYRAFAAVAGHVPGRYSLLRSEVETNFNVFSDAVRGTQAARQAIAAAGETAVASGVIDRPNLVAYTYAPAADAQGALSSLQIAADLLVQSSQGAGSSDATPYGVLAGVTAHVAEETALDPRLFELMEDVAAAPAVSGDRVSVGRIFAAAEERQVGWRVVAAADDLASLPFDVPGAARALVTAHLDGGRVVVMPAEAVELDGVEALGWWVYDPATGALFDQLPDGSSGVFAEYAVKLRNIAIAAAPFLANAECVAALASAANDLLSGDTWGAAAGAVEKFGACA